MLSSDVDKSTLANKSVVVTGGGGFIGSHLTESLVDLAADVTVVDDFSEGDRRNLDSVTEEISIEPVDIRDRDEVSLAVSGSDLIFHLGANAHVPTSVEKPDYDFKVNAVGTHIILDEARKNDVNRVVLASSAAVYGPPKETPMTESHPLNPVSPYGASKLAGEKLGMSYNEAYDIQVTALRIFNTFGPRQPRYVMFDFLRKLDEDSSKLEVLGSGEEVRTFSYVSDTVDALIALGVSEKAPGEAFNFGGDTQTRIRDLAEMMSDHYYDGEPKIEVTNEAKAGDISRLVPSNEKISQLGVTPDHGLSEGLDELYDWYHREYKSRQ